MGPPRTLDTKLTSVNVVRTSPEISQGGGKAEKTETADCAVPGGSASQRYEHPALAPRKNPVSGAANTLGSSPPSRWPQAGSVLSSRPEGEK